MKRMIFKTIVLAAVLAISGGIAAAQVSFPEEDIQKFVTQLGDDDAVKRDEATKKLIEIGSAAAEAVEKASKSEDPEVAWRAGKILESIKVAPQAGQPQPRQLKKPGPQDNRVIINPKMHIQTSNLSITKDSDGSIIVTANEEGPDGKTELKTYQAKSLEEFMTKYPDIAEKYNINEKTFSSDSFSFSFDFNTQSGNESIEDIIKEFEGRMKEARPNAPSVPPDGDVDDIIDEFFKDFDSRFDGMDDFLKKYKGMQEEMDKFKKMRPGLRPAPESRPVPEITGPDNITGQSMRPKKLADDLGAEFGQVEGKDAEGLVIVRLAPEGPVGKAGLLEKDIIRSVNGAAVRTFFEFRKQLVAAMGGEEAEIAVVRNGETKVIKAKTDSLSARK